MLLIYFLSINITIRSIGLETKQEEKKTRVKVNQLENDLLL